MTKNFNIYAIESDNIWPNYGDWSFPERAKSIIYVFARDENKKKVVKVIKNFSPYFFIKQNDKIPIVFKQYIKSISPSEIINFKGEKLCKVETVNSKVVKPLRNELEKIGIEHFQADILYRLNFTLKHHDDLEKQGYIFGINNSRLWVLDIETTTREDSIDIANTPEDIISISIHDNYTNKYHTFIWRKDFEKMKESDGDKVVHFFTTEIEMLNNFLDFWKELSPDIITGWNSNGFDIPYIINRCDKLKVDKRRMSPVNRCWCWEQKSETGGESYFNPQILGVVLLDAYKWYKEVHLDQLRSYSLDNVAKDEGLGSKEKINPQYLWETDWKRLIEYNVHDVFLTKEIIEKRKIIDFVAGIRKVAWSNFEDLSYFSRSIDMLLLQEAKKRNIALPSKLTNVSYKSKEQREAAYAGGHVFAEKGIYHNGIGVFDFSALYPSIYRTFNISYETINEEGKGIEFEIPKGVDEDGEKVKIFVSQETEGLIPSILENLTSLRDKYEVGMKNSKTTKEAEDYDQLIQATKNLILTSYGTTAMQSFRLFKREVSSLVTYVGRTMIREMAKYAESKKMKVCYNDTDSVFIILGSYESEVGKKLESELNEHILKFCKEKWNIDFDKNLLKLKFEKLYKTLLVDTKKRYAGHLIWKKEKVRDEIQVSGIQAKRSDVSLQTQSLQLKVLELILKSQSQKEVEKLIFEEIEKVQKCKDYEYVAFPVRLGKDKYENNLPKVRGVEYAKKFLNLYLLVGMKPLLIYIKHGSEDSLCFEHNGQLKDKEIKVDVEKMIDRNILKPLESILSIWKGEKYFNVLKTKIKFQLNGQRDLWNFNEVATKEIKNKNESA